jgi:hypothetical protein
MKCLVQPTRGGTPSASEHGNKLSGFIKRGESLLAEQLLALKMDSTAWC